MAASEQLELFQPPKTIEEIKKAINPKRIDEKFLKQITKDSAKKLLIRH